MSDQSNFTSDVKEEFPLSVHFEGKNYELEVTGRFINGKASYEIRFTTEPGEVLHLERIEDPELDDNLLWRATRATYRSQALIDAIGDAIDRYEL